MRRPRRLQPFTPAWERLANDLARQYAPQMYPCGACGGPVVRGYCCTRCGETNPEVHRDKRKKNVMQKVESTKHLTLGLPVPLSSIPTGLQIYGLDATTRVTPDALPTWPDGGLRWSGQDAYVTPPAIGTVVRVGINGIGLATVVGYFVEHGFLGLAVLPKHPPDWYVRQNGHDQLCHVFGAELGGLST